MHHFYSICTRCICDMNDYRTKLCTAWLIFSLRNAQSIVIVFGVGAVLDIVVIIVHLDMSLPQLLHGLVCVVSFVDSL